jgi:hypothetical protein
LAPQHFANHADTTKHNNKKETKLNTLENSGIKLEEVIHQLLTESKFVPGPFEIGKALLFGVSLKEDLNIEILALEEDVYQLLDSRVNQLAGSTFDAVAVVTTGWAAPLDQWGKVTGRPSEHKERRRVRLVVLANKQDTMNVLRFADDPDDVITDGGSAMGSLAEAVQEFLNKEGK